MDYNEPVKGHNFQFTLIKRSELRHSRYQRVLSSALVKKLINSVSKGFIIPLIVVVEIENGQTVYTIVDGQHRLGALEHVMSTADPLIPCIIVTPEFKNYPLFYNIEKSDNIKDKAAKMHKLYLDKSTTELTEHDISPAANYEHYIFTIAFAHCEFGLKSPSLVEPPVKKVDNSYIMSIDEGGYPKPMLLAEAIEIRRGRASLTAQLENAVEDIANEYQISDFNLKRTMVSKSSQALWGNKRKIDEVPEDAIPALTQQILETDWSWMAGR